MRPALQTNTLFGKPQTVKDTPSHCFYLITAGKQMMTSSLYPCVPDEKPFGLFGLATLILAYFMSMCDCFISGSDVQSLFLISFIVYIHECYLRKMFSVQLNWFFVSKLVTHSNAFSFFDTSKCNKSLVQCGIRC